MSEVERRRTNVATVIDEIRQPFEDGDQEAVFALVGKLLEERDRDQSTQWHINNMRGALTRHGLELDVGLDDEERLHRVIVTPFPNIGLFRQDDLWQVGTITEVDGGRITYTPISYWTHAGDAIAGMTAVVVWFATALDHLQRVSPGMYEGFRHWLAMLKIEEMRSMLHSMLGALARVKTAPSDEEE